MNGWHNYTSHFVIVLKLYIMVWSYLGVRVLYPAQQWAYANIILTFWHLAACHSLPAHFHWHLLPPPSQNLLHSTIQANSLPGDRINIYTLLVYGQLQTHACVTCTLLTTNKWNWDASTVTYKRYVRTCVCAESILATATIAVSPVCLALHAEVWESLTPTTYTQKLD